MSGARSRRKGHSEPREISQQAHHDVNFKPKKEMHMRGSETSISDEQLLEFYDANRDRIERLQEPRKLAAQWEREDHLRSLGEEKERRRRSGLCTACGLRRPQEVKDDITTQFLEGGLFD